MSTLNINNKQILKSQDKQGVGCSFALNWNAFDYIN